MELGALQNVDKRNCRPERPWRSCWRLILTSPRKVFSPPWRSPRKRRLAGVREVTSFDEPKMLFLLLWRTDSTPEPRLRSCSFWAIMSFCNGGPHKKQRTLDFSRVLFWWAGTDSLPESAPADAIMFFCNGGPHKKQRTLDFSRVLFWWAGTDSNRRTDNRADLQSALPSSVCWPKR